MLVSRGDTLVKAISDFQSLELGVFPSLVHLKNFENAVDNSLVCFRIRSSLIFFMLSFTFSFFLFFP